MSFQAGDRVLIRDAWGDGAEPVRITHAYEFAYICATTKGAIAYVPASLVIGRDPAPAAGVEDISARERIPGPVEPTPLEAAIASATNPAAKPAAPIADRPPAPAAVVELAPAKPARPIRDARPKPPGAVQLGLFG